MKGPVVVRHIAVAAVVLASSSLAFAQQPMRLAITDGRVTLHVQNVPVRTILAEWARQGGTTIVNGDRVAGSALTLDLEDMPERQALNIILRGVSGYLLAARDPGRAGASMFDRLIILPTSVAPRAPQGPAPVVRGVSPTNAPLPSLVRPDSQDLNADGDPATDGGDGPRPAAPTRQVVAPPGLPTVPPATLDTPDDAPATAAPAPPVVVGTPANPFGMPPGSSLRPGVISTPPPPAPAPRETPQN